MSWRLLPVRYPHSPSLGHDTGDITARVTLLAGGNIDPMIWHSIQLWHPDPDAVLVPENKKKPSIFLPAFLAVRYFRWQEPGVPSFCVCFRASPGSEVFSSSFYFTPQLSITVFASLYAEVYSLLQSNTAFTALISLNLWFKLFFFKQEASSGGGSWTRGDGEKTSGKHLPAGVLFLCSCLLTSWGAEAGCRAGCSVWPHLAAFVHDLGVSHFVSSQSSCKSQLAPCWCVILPRWNTTTSIAVSPQDLQKKVRDIQLVKGVEFPCQAQRGYSLVRHSSLHFWFHFFFSGNIIFADNLSSGQKSRRDSPQADWWLPEAGVARQAAEHCFLQGLSQSRLGLQMDCIRRQPRSCSMLTFYGSFFPSHYI